MAILTMLRQLAQCRYLFLKSTYRAQVTVCGVLPDPLDGEYQVYIHIHQMVNLAEERENNSNKKHHYSYSVKCIFLLILIETFSFMTHELFTNVLSSFQIFGIFKKFLFYCFPVGFHCGQRHPLYDFNSFTFFEVCFVAWGRCILLYVCRQLKIIYILLFLCGLFYICQFEPINGFKLLNSIFFKYVEFCLMLFRGKFSAMYLQIFFSKLLTFSSPSGTQMT